MTMKRYFFLIIVAAMTAAAGSARTLDECQQLARNHYPEISQYDLIAQTEQYNLSNAARAWLPQIALSAQATWQTDVAKYPEALSSILTHQGLNIPGMRKDQYKVAIDVSQNIWDGGQSKANRTLAEAEAAEQRSRVDVDLYALQSRVENLYFGILLLDERVAQTEALIELLESNLSRMRVYYKNGVAMQADVDAVEAELLTARQTLSQVSASRTSYRRMLELFIGQPLEAETLERPEATEPAGLTSARPELALFEAQRGIIEARRNSVNSSLMPRFSAFAQGFYGYPGLDMFKSMMSADWRLNAIVGLRVSWNIGAFYTRRNNLGKLDAARKQIDVQRDVFLFNNRIQATQDEGEIARLRQAVADDEKIVSLRRSVRKAAESKLQNGVIDATDLLRKITDETSAALNRSTHEIQLLQTIYRLKYILNQ